jgi:cellulose synthase/poly-beta-1,6-N-acetylglucosamine synthase-like glycosyltransferase
MLINLFIATLVLVAYPVAIYPVIVAFMAAVRSRPWKCSLGSERVAVVIAAFNEEARIRRKLENAMGLHPPPSDVEIIVAGDGSTDGTRGIVEEFAAKGVRWVGCPRGGKEAAQKAAIQASRAGIFVFTDVGTMIEPDGLVEIIRPFGDPSIGAVGGADRVSETENTGERTYLWCETALRRAESRCSSSVGLSGCFFAVRREIATELREDVDSDLGAALLCIRGGYRAIMQETARCSYGATSSVAALFQRWRRTALRGIRCLWTYRAAISWRRPMLSWQIISHKWLRYLTPFLVGLALGLASWAAVQGDPWGLLVLTTAAVLSLLGMLAFFPKCAFLRLRQLRPVGFVLVAGLAVLAAWCSLLLGSKDTTWTPTARK